MAWLTIICTMLLFPGKSVPGTSLFSMDKAVHVAMFAILSLLLVIGLRKQRSFLLWKTNAKRISLTISIVVGAVLELLQNLSADRTPDIYDIMANTVGAVIGLLVFFILYEI